MGSTSQEQVFAQSEGDAWFGRNRQALAAKRPENDPIHVYLSQHQKPLQIASVLEVGCANGYRLSWLKAAGLKVFGFDPSQSAIKEAREKYQLSHSEVFVPENLSELWRSGELARQVGQKVDCVVFAHCLYLIPPSQYPWIVANTLELLEDGGVIMIYDFDSPPQRTRYHHVECGVWSWKMHFEEMFTWLPSLKLIHKSVHQHDGSASIGNAKEDCALSVIRKCSLEMGFNVLAQ